jgi:alcohol dehydrogenase class IV
MADGEVFKAAFSSSLGSNLAGIPVTHLDLPGPTISSGLPYEAACAKHIKNTYNASRVFIIASRSLSRNTDKLDLLVDAIEEDNVVGIQIGMISHSLWSEILSVSQEARSKNVDCIVTLGAGSITDAAKLVVFVRLLTNTTSNY